MAWRSMAGNVALVVLRTARGALLLVAVLGFIAVATSYVAPLELATLTHERLRIVKGVLTIDNDYKKEKDLWELLNASEYSRNQIDAPPSEASDLEVMTPQPVPYGSDMGSIRDAQRRDSTLLLAFSDVGSDRVERALAAEREAASQIRKEIAEEVRIMKLVDGRIANAKLAWSASYSVWKPVVGLWVLYGAVALPVLLTRRWRIQRGFSMIVGAGSSHSS